MAGHSKFKNIMHRKGAQDKKRSAAFSKLSREITVAAKMGTPDPDMNPRLRLAVNNAKAVLEALFGEPGEFTRTPKYGIEKRADDWHQKKYHQSMPIQPLIEFGLGLYFTATVIYALSHEIYGTVPFLALFQFGFLYMGGMSILQQFGHDSALEKAPQVASGK